MVDLPEPMSPMSTTFFARAGADRFSTAFPIHVSRITHRADLRKDGWHEFRISIQRIEVARVPRRPSARAQFRVRHALVVQARLRSVFGSEAAGMGLLNRRESSVKHSRWVMGASSTTLKMPGDDA